MTRLKRYLTNIRWRRKEARPKVLFRLAVLCALLQSGCGPTYPMAMVDKAVVQLCKEEYGIDVKVKLANSTIAVYLPLENLLDQTFGLSKEATDRINDVVLSVSRVTLSTDAPIKFYIVITQDPKFPELEVVIIRYVNDIKLVHFNQISRGEFFNRALIELKITPQAQKEEILKTIFEQLKVEQTGALLNEFMTKDVTTIGDIGYWDNEFFIKEINLEEFLALQIASRVRNKFDKEPALKEKFKLSAIKGEFVPNPTGSIFDFYLSATSALGPEPFLSEQKSDVLFETALKEIAEVLCGYKFEGFGFVSVSNDVSGESLSITRKELEDFRKNKIKFKDLKWKK